MQIDKEGANIERVRNELSEQGLVWDQWGGDTAMLPVSINGKHHTVPLLCCVLGCHVLRQRVLSLLWLLSCPALVTLQHSAPPWGLLASLTGLAASPAYLWMPLQPGCLTSASIPACPAKHAVGHAFLPTLQISAKKGTGVDELLETLALTAEVEDLKANPERAAAGTVIEAHLDKRTGAVTTLLVQTGTLRVGDVIQTGACYGKVMHGATVAGYALIVLLVQSGTVRCGAVVQTGDVHGKVRLRFGRTRQLLVGVCRVGHAVQSGGCCGKLRRGVPLLIKI